MGRALVLVAGLLSLLIVCCARTGVAASSVAAGLHKQKTWERQAAAKQILEQREQTIQQLIAILHEKGINRDFGGPLHLAIDLLGKLRAPQAVPHLCKLLTYLPEGEAMRHETIPSEAYYVAAVALWRIGGPAVNAMEVTIRKSKDDTERKLAAWVIMQIEGKEQALARMDRWAGSRRIGADHFRQAKTFIETYKPVFEHPRQAKKTQ